MNSVSEDIKDILELSASGLTLTFATDLFVSKEPDTPDAAVTIYDGVGGPPDVQHRLDYPGVQVRIRGARNNGYAAAYSLAEDIKLVLNGYAGKIINSTTYVLIRATTDILFLGYDDNDRPMFVINFDIIRTE